MHTLSPDKEPIAILVTLDALYLRPLCVMLRSLAARTPERDFRVFVRAEEAFYFAPLFGTKNINISELMSSMKG